MLFPYRPSHLTRPAATVGGASVRMRPLLNITAIGPTGTVARQVIVDTGSDEVVFGYDDAVRLGVDLTNAPTGISAGVGSSNHIVRYAWVKLRLTDGIDYREWDALVGFAPFKLPRALFGIAHGLEYFTATFHGDRRELELVPNAAYPGT